MLDFSKPATKIGWLILNGQPVESDIAYQEIYSKAKHSIFIIDNYISLKTLVLFKDVAPNVEITVFSDNINKGLHQIEFNDFLAEYPSLKINTFYNIWFIQTSTINNTRNSYYLLNWSYTNSLTKLTSKPQAAQFTTGTLLPTMARKPKKSTIVVRHQKTAAERFLPSRSLPTMQSTRR